MSWIDWNTVSSWKERPFSNLCDPKYNKLKTLKTALWRGQNKVALFALTDLLKLIIITALQPEWFNRNGRQRLYLSTVTADKCEPNLCAPLESALTINVFSLHFTQPFPAGSSGQAASTHRLSERCSAELIASEWSVWMAPICSPPLSAPRGSSILRLHCDRTGTYKVNTFLLYNTTRQQAED